MDSTMTIALATSGVLIAKFVYICGKLGTNFTI
jgi:hypothetical protein